MKNELLENQDINIYYGCNFWEEILFFNTEPQTGVIYSQLIEKVYNKEEIVKKISTKNLLIMFVSLNEEKSKLVLEELKNRIEQGENPFCQSNFEMGIMSKKIPLWKIAYVKLPKEIRDKLENDIQHRIEKLDNNEFTNIMKNCKNSFNYNYFIDLYKSGLISEKALSIMQELIETGEESFNSVDFSMFQDDFLKIEKEVFFNIIKYPNICKKLNILKDNYPELFELCVSKVNSMVMENEQLSAIHSVIERLLRNFTLYGQYFLKLDKADCLKYGLNKYNNFNDYLKQNDLGEIQSLEQFLDKEDEKNNDSSFNTVDTYNFTTKLDISINNYNKGKIIKNQNDGLLINGINNLEYLDNFDELGKDKSKIISDYIDNIEQQEIESVYKYIQHEEDSNKNNKDSLLNQNSIVTEQINTNLHLDKKDDVNNKKKNVNNKLIVRNNSIREKAGRFLRKLRFKFNLKFGVERL